jgi:hypothetical protein
MQNFFAREQSPNADSYLKLFKSIESGQLFEALIFLNVREA